MSDKPSLPNHPLEKKLDVLIRLVALSVAPENMTIVQRAALLSRAGLQSKEIAELCDTTRNTISVALSNQKRKSHKPAFPKQKK